MLGRAPREREGGRDGDGQGLGGSAVSSGHTETEAVGTGSGAEPYSSSGLLGLSAGLLIAGRNGTQKQHALETLPVFLAKNF